MSEGEIFAFVIALILAFIFWLGWVRPFFTLRRSGFHPIVSACWLLSPLVCLVMLYSVLRRFASWDVQHDPKYIVFYLVMGLAWLGGAIRVLAWLNLSFRDDVLERNNPAAAHALGGAAAGLMACFAGANIGDGPGFTVVLVSAALATGTWFVLWIATNLFAGSTETITVERDQATGWRLGGLAVMWGLICGRGAAGDWISNAKLLEDFIRVLWPLLFMMLPVMAFERFQKPRNGLVGAAPLIFGVMPALIYVSIGIFYVIGMGPW